MDVGGQADFALDFAAAGVRVTHRFQCFLPAKKLKARATGEHYRVRGVRIQRENGVQIQREWACKFSAGRGANSVWITGLLHRLTHDDRGCKFSARHGGRIPRTHRNEV